jgi:hypothetical protein
MIANDSEKVFSAKRASLSAAEIVVGGHQFDYPTGLPIILVPLQDG